ncbi:MAG: prepilin-type N-terminal cleavage/methylation domain-containing protein [Acidimicrobiia bacterium]|nr:prepilin-type N-terminal cleavage/methylation domain-containing protein [Acidimicrobiia bacterium]
MLEILKNRLEAARGREEGFTLIELMVVVLIIAVLLAIAIPTFLGAQSKAKDRSAQSSARNAVTAANTIYADGGDFTAATAGELAAVEPSLTYAAAATASTGPKDVSVETDPDTVWMAAKSETGTCFYIQDDKGGSGTQFAKGPGACSADAAQDTAVVPAADWSDKW